MKRLQYMSRWSRPLRQEDIVAIAEASTRNNVSLDVTGFLVCLPGFFFQLLEGPDRAVDELFERIRADDRHGDVVCLNTEEDVVGLNFPKWSMKTFDLTHGDQIFPSALESMLHTLANTHEIIAKYTQPTVLNILGQGIDPTTVAPRRVDRIVLFTDIVGFSTLSERLAPETVVEVVDRFVDICAEAIAEGGGEVSKLIGDSLMACFPATGTDEAISACVEIHEKVARLRESGRTNHPIRWLYNGIGLSRGTVVEGNVGSKGKKDFTVIGDTVNLAARLEKLTRQVCHLFVVSEDIKNAASHKWTFQFLGEYPVRSKQRPARIWALQDSGPTDLKQVYQGLVELTEGSID